MTVTASQRAAAAMLILVTFLGITIARNALWKDPVLLLEDTIRKSPSKMRLYLNLGKLHHDRGQYEQAMRRYLQALALDPVTSIKVYSNIGYVYLDTGQFDKAAEMFSRILSIDSRDFMAAVGRGRAWYGLGRYERALTDLDRAVGIDPASVRSRYYRAETLVKLGLNERALYDLEPACNKGWMDSCDRMKELKRN